jgi:hypothetical protein
MTKRKGERCRLLLPFHGWRWALGASTLLTGVAVVGVRPAAAQTFHSYSVASQTTPSGAFTGVATTRQDVPVANIPDTGCSGYFSGNPVYQTEWIYITSDGANWLELGTGHQCMNTLVYWYAGYGFAGTWHPLWEESGITPAGHDFQIYEFGSSYKFQIDSTVFARQSTSPGYTDVTGLESYAGSAVVNQYTHGTLQYQTGGSGPWANWFGEEGEFVGSNMCGTWQNPTTWSVAENSSC